MNIDRKGLFYRFIYGMHMDAPPEHRKFKEAKTVCELLLHLLHAPLLWVLYALLATLLNVLLFFYAEQITYDAKGEIIFVQASWADKWLFRFRGKLITPGMMMVVLLAALASAAVIYTGVITIYALYVVTALVFGPLAFYAGVAALMVFAVLLWYLQRSGALREISAFLVALGKRVKDRTCVMINYAGQAN